MEVEVSKEKICINKLVAEKKELVFVQNETIVPDSKPDILSTINVAGNCCVYKKEIGEDKVKLEGTINTYVMYLPDSKNENLRALNFDLDFSENIAVQGAKEGMILVTKCNIKDMECKLINGRKISVKAGLEFDIKLYSNEDVEIVSGINNIDDIQTLRQTFNVNSIIGNGKTVVYAKDTLNVDAKDEVAEILKVDVDLVNKDLKLSYNKILTKAEADVKIMYLTEAGSVGRIDGKIPVVGFIDIEKISDNNICDVNYEIKNIQIRLNPAEEHSIYVELEIEPTCMAYEKKEINLIQDLYSPRFNLEFSQRNVLSVADKSEGVKNFTIKDKLQVSGLEGGNLLDVEAIPTLANVKVTSSKITYSGEINLNFIFRTENTLNSRTSKLPFEVSEENTYNQEQINVDADLSLGNTTFEVQAAGEVRAEAELEVFTKVSKNVNMNIIDNIEVSSQDQDEDDYDSLILYIVKDGDTLWKIAKTFNSTVESLSRLNGIEDADSLSIGQKIYIPKFNYIKKESKEDEREKAYI